MSRTFKCDRCGKTYTTVSLACRMKNETTTKLLLSYFHNPEITKLYIGLCDHCWEDFIKFLKTSSKVACVDDKGGEEK